MNKININKTGGLQMIKTIIFLVFILQTNYLTANSIYTCTNPDNSTVMQSKPCNSNQASKRLDYNFKKNNEIPWYKKNNNYIQNKNIYTNNKTLSKNKSKDNNNLTESKCDKLKNQLKANDDLRFDIKNRRDYSRNQKKLYRDKSYELLRIIKKSCNEHKYKPKNY